jgi:lysophospholipase L1-like esterase
MRFNRLLGCLAVAAVAAVCAAAAPAQATRYVALGDSYSSGTGTRSYYDRACRRSVHSHPYLLRLANPDWEFTHAACSGAKTGDVLRSQVAGLSGGADLVTYTLGGNDAGFSKVVKECALPAWASGCHSRIDGAQAYLANVLPRRLDRVNARIKALAPAARVIVLGYPHLFMGEDCDPATFFSPAEQTRLNLTADLLRDQLRDAASRAGPLFEFVDPIPSFSGHAICDSASWLNGLTAPLRESYHPNRRGQRLGYFSAVRAVTD